MEQGKLSNKEFLELYRRHDSGLYHAVLHELRGLANREEPAREIIDQLWIEIWSHPRCIRAHNPSQRPLHSYLLHLGHRRARRYLKRLKTKASLPTVHLEGQEIYDKRAQDDAQLERWQGLCARLTSHNRKRIQHMLVKDGPRSDAERKLLQRLRRKFRGREILKHF
jgi:hypothetical protein